MTRFVILGLLATVPIAAICAPARGQTTITTTTGSVGCTAINQQAANGMTARIGADDQTVNAPMSVKSMTCLNNFFSGTGLNVITNILNPANLLTAVEGQICQLVTSKWDSLIGSAQCGLTLTGFNYGFGGLGGGLSCPKLSFGGGGPPVGSVGLGATSGGGLYIPGNGLAPTGYAVPNIPPGAF